MPQTPDQIRSNLIGTWKLISLQSKPVSGDGPTGYPLGPDAKGYLTYTAQGYMFAQLMRPGARPYTVENPYQASDEEAGEAARHFMAYCGPFEVFLRGEQPFLKHYTDVALVPQWAGGFQIRKCGLEGDELVLEPEQPWVMDVSKVLFAWLGI